MPTHRLAYSTGYDYKTFRSTCIKQRLNSLSSGLGSSWLSLLVDLDSWSWNRLVLLLVLSNHDSIWQSLWTELVLSWVSHDLDSDTQNTLSHQNVSDGSVNELSGWLTRVDHETVSVLLGLGSGSSQLTRNDNLNTLGTSSHGESQDTVSGSSDWQTTQQLSLQSLGLDSSRKSSLFNSLSVDDNTVLRQLESLDNQRSQFVDSSTLLTQNTLGVRSLNNDFSLGVGLSDLNTSVTLFGQFSGEEFVQFGVEDTVSDQLSLLGQDSLGLSRHCCLS
ncbi:conserved hypothetical protein [Clavispora lusitaniae ATCC 42720]|uniref:Uncharacterized protein n=1 Tax=Clavispora lusitaniae (strain ATCC 42720) TaxID=306902 RepID=C4Y3Q6_CLAL4|nr:uncharacterized protein CLUG_03169 [Clavispora lusitaniae ATCC 42720]EEQ39044.1 conserved hypothetical protein [Clavispora lusitaniae ATCC 42720]